MNAQLNSSNNSNFWCCGYNNRNSNSSFSRCHGISAAAESSSKSTRTQHPKNKKICAASDEDSPKPKLEPKSGVGRSKHGGKAIAALMSLANAFEGMQSKSGKEGGGKKGGIKGKSGKDDDGGGGKGLVAKEGGGGEPKEDGDHEDHEIMAKEPMPKAGGEEVMRESYICVKRQN